MWEIIEKEILPFVEKPARYIGGEFNSVLKDHRNKTSIALIYPDLYEIGISNIGLKILYNILNKRKNIVCETAYSPWFDMEEALRSHNLSLYSLETKKPLRDFDILGFSFQYELLFTNFLNILDLSGIPFCSKDRTMDYPFIIAGGPVSYNLEPIAHFLDAVCVGDGESVIIRMVETISKGKENKKSRNEILEDLSRLDGVYVPSLYNETEKNGYIIPSGKRVKRAIIPDLNRVDFVTKQILPNIQAIQDRAVVEVSRGCTRGCRFCQAGITYRPVRERQVSGILKIAREAVKQTGYREFSLISLSISDYSELKSLIQSLDLQFSRHGVSFSLPSLRLDTFTLELAQKVKEIRKSGLTFAVEGGTQEIRDSINKGVKEEELLNVIKIARDLGWKSIKLYFMAGLPTLGLPNCILPSGENRDEIEGIAGLIDRIAYGIKGITITVSVAVFIPKAHTPFQWESQMSPDKGNEEFHRLIRLLKKYRNVNIRYNNPYMSWLEGIFSRGDRRLSKVIETAFRKGARFDGWNDKVRLDLWMEAFRETGINPDFYLQEKKAENEFPWDIIDTGIRREFILSEKKKSTELNLTKDCREICYNSCGNCDDSQNIRPVLAFRKNKLIRTDKKFLDNILIESRPEYVMRFIHTKKGSFKFLSPVDFEELLSRAFIRANLPASFTKGFNPHIRIESGWALPTGFSSDYEAAEVEFSKMVSPLRFKMSINKVLPAGVIILKARIFKLPHIKLGKISKEQLIQFKMDNPFSKEKILENLNGSKNFKKITPKTEKIIDLKEFIKSLDFIDGQIYITYVQKEGGARIQDIIAGLTGYDVRSAVKLNPTVIKRFIEKNGINYNLIDA